MSDSAAMMSSKINILFIDDSRDDAELAALKLKRAGVTVSYRRVATLRDVEAAIIDTRWDVILCDCKLPGFTAFNVWSMLQNLGVNTPFAVFADLVLNTEIRRLLDAGVHRFIDKNHLDELEPALRRFVRHEKHDQNDSLSGNGH